MIRKIIFSIAFTIFSVALSAQGHDAFVRRLSQPDSTHRTRVEVVAHGQASEAIAAMSHNTGAQKIRGYRVRIFLDNSQSARSRASDAVSKFSSEYPDIPAYTIYENPYWKVSVGNCITSEEAITLWGKVKGSFDRAFVVREDIPILTLSE